MTGRLQYCSSRSGNDAVEQRDELQGKDPLALAKERGCLGRRQVRGSPEYIRFQNVTLRASAWRAMVPVPMGERPRTTRMNRWERPLPKMPLRQLRGTTTVEPRAAGFGAPVLP